MVVGRETLSVKLRAIVNVGLDMEFGYCKIIRTRTHNMYGNAIIHMCIYVFKLCLMFNERAHKHIPCGKYLTEPHAKILNG